MTKGQVQTKATARVSKRLRLWAGLTLLILLSVLAACGDPTNSKGSIAVTNATSEAATAPATVRTASTMVATTISATTTASITATISTSIPTTFAAESSVAVGISAASSNVPSTSPTLSPTGEVETKPATDQTTAPTQTSIPITQTTAQTGLQTLWHTGSGEKEERLKNLLGLATDSAGSLYLSNSAPNLLRKYNSAGQLLFQYPQNLTGFLATDNQDNLYVLDGDKTLFKFDSTGKQLLIIQVERPGSGPFSGLSGLAVDEKGVIYILDAGGRVFKFDKTGHYLTFWGNPSDGNSNPNFTNPKPGGLSYPIGLTADGQGHIYVSDFSSENSQVNKYDSNGKFLLAFGTPGGADGQFGKYSLGGGLTTDKVGNIYVVDWENHRVEKFDAQGHFLKTIPGSTGAGGIQFNQPVAVAIDRQGNLFVADNFNEQVQKIGPNGKLLVKYGRQDQGEGKLDYPSGIGVDAQGNIYVADGTTRLIQKFDRDGHFVTMWPVVTKAVIHAFKDDTLLQIGVAGDGSIYVADHLDKLIKKYDSSGKFLLEWGGAGSKEGQFNELNGPNNPFIDVQGNIYIADGGNSRIQKFNSDGNFLSQLKFPDEPASENSNRSPSPAYPSAVAVDNTGIIYVTFSSCSCLKKYAKDGQFLLEWGRPPSGIFGNSGSLTIPDGLAIDGHGKIYVMEMRNLHCINCGLVKYDPSGNLLREWSSLFSPTPLNPPPAPQDGQFAVISAMTVDASGNIYVGEPGYLRIQKFRQTGGS